VEELYLALMREGKGERRDDSPIASDFASAMGDEVGEQAGSYTS